MKERETACLRLLAVAFLPPQVCFGSSPTLHPSTINPHIAGAKSSKTEIRVITEGPHVSDFLLLPFAHAGVLWTLHNLHPSAINLQGAEARGNERDKEKVKKNLSQASCLCLLKVQICFGTSPTTQAPYHKPL